jgi:hypothetical protein
LDLFIFYYSFKEDTMINDLRDWIQKAEEIGELKRVEKEVDWDQELTAIDYLVGRRLNLPHYFLKRLRVHPPGTAFWEMSQVPLPIGWL